MKKSSTRPGRRQQQKKPEPKPQEEYQRREEYQRPSGRRGWVLALLFSWGGFVASMVFASTHLSACSLMSISNDISYTQPVGKPSASSTAVALTDDEDEEEQAMNGHEGILSKKPDSFFGTLQEAVDKQDLVDRCKRYEFPMQHPDPSAKQQALPRRIFYGALIADEPWELLDIIAKETHGIFAGMVFVESNFTQDCFHRNWAHAYKPESEKRLKEMFGTNVKVNPFLNFDKTKRDLTRENLQRQEILKGWKAMGMQPDDIGLLADVDETFTRDFLNALMHCPYIKEFDYNLHKCDNCIAKIRGLGRVFETSPNCITKERSWMLPNAVMGACLEEIGDPVLHPPPERGQYYKRNPGYADKCGDSGPHNTNMPDGKFPLFNAADYRFLAGGRVVPNMIDPSKGTRHSAFHFHNFFANFTKTRYKYYTYGHALPTAMTDRLEDIQEDLRFMMRCLFNQTDGTTDPNNFRWLVYHHPEWQRYNRIVGGVRAALPPLPIYFMDEDYVQRKHKFARRIAQADELQRQIKLGWSPDQIRLDAIRQEQREARRVMEAKDLEANKLEAKINATLKKG